MQRYFYFLAKLHLTKIQCFSLFIYSRRDLNHFMTKVHYAVTTRCSQVPTVRSTLLGKVQFQKQEYTKDVQSNTSSFPKQNVPQLK